ncbi:MAG TPA: glycosyltransferase, partial [Actinomycetota bacterium]|nr:glycosyltransferase [Actinomycetota bacterium]
MHVALITRYPPRHALDAGRGTAGYSKRLARALVAGGCRVTVLADLLDGEQPEYEEDGVIVRRVWGSGRHAISPIVEAIGAIRPDIVHLQHELF